MTRCDARREVALSIFMHAHYLLSALYTLCLNRIKILQGNWDEFLFLQHGNLSSEMV